MSNPRSARDWEPQRRGAIYCSPACGGDCTWAEYQRAKRCAERLARKLPGFEPVVKENLGWHWGADALGGLIYITTGYKKWGPPYHVFASIETRHAGNYEWGSFEVRDPRQVVPGIKRRLRSAIAYRQKFLDKLEELPE
ncbi:MAG: hypothetical protein ABFE07_28935 [Armatimonadia bacterium]